MCDVCRGTNSSRCPVCGEQDELVICPECGGTGYGLCWAIDLRTGNEVEVTAETYVILPDDIQEAQRKGNHYSKSYADDCELCMGRGEVWEDSDGNYRAI